MIRKIPFRLLAVIMTLLLLIQSVPCEQLAVIAAAAEPAFPDRYLVIVMDISGKQEFIMADGSTAYTADSALRDVKTSTQNLLGELEKHNKTKKGGHYYAALVTYAESATAYNNGEFTDDFAQLANQAARISEVSSSRSMTSGLKCAETCLKNVTDPNAQKNIVIFNTGMSDCGASNEKGQYDFQTVGGSWSSQRTGLYLFEYGNTVYETAMNLKKQGVIIYSIGLFQPMNKIPVAGKNVAQLFRLISSDIASSSEHFFAVDDPVALEYTVDGFQKKLLSTKYQGTFRFPSGNKKDFSAKYYFDEGYFADSSTIYNAGLATMTLDFVLSAFNSNEAPYEYKSKNAKALLKELEFKNVEISKEYELKPEGDTMAAIAGYKTIDYGNEQFTLIAFSTRGGGYEAEWAGNFNVGKTGRHSGFNLAATQAKEFLKEYIAKYKDQFENRVKLWMGGYSRGAATANLAAADITKAGGIGGITLEKEDIYAYCFEVPMAENLSNVSRTECRAMNNIHCIINPYDPVPKVAMALWGFTAYGVYEPVIPTAESVSDYEQQLSEMRKHYKALDNDNVHSTYLRSKLNSEDDPYADEKILFELFNKPSLRSIYFNNSKNPDSLQVLLANQDWLKFKDQLCDLDFLLLLPDKLIMENANISMATFLNQLVNVLADAFQNRSYYVDTYQEAIRDFIRGTKSEGYEHAAKLSMFLTSLFSRMITNNGLISYYIILLDTVRLQALMSQIVKDSLNEADILQIDFTTEDIAGTLADILTEIMKNCGNVEFLYTLIRNADMLFTTHYPELCLAWLEAKDPYHNGTLKPFSGRVYRIIRINCPVDVEIRSSFSNVLASIVNDVPQEIEGSSIVAEVNFDGEKVIYLPEDAYYSIHIKARENCTVDCSVSEFSFENQSVVREVSFQDISMSKDSELNGYVCNIQEFETDSEYVNSGSSTKVKLRKSGQDITPVYDRKGEDVTNVYYTVSAVPETMNLGIINGGGTFKEDTFAQLSAAPLEGNTFVGWFENDELVSSNPTYRFRVESDRTITAKFEGEPIDRTINHLFSLVAPGGSASMEEETKMFYQKGDTVTLKAEANEGMKFVRWEAEDGVFADASSPETVFTMPDCDILVIAVFESENPEPQTTDTTAVTETTTSETTAQTTAVKGDVNCDGELTVADAVFLCRVIAEDTSVVISENGKVNADVNGDGTITTDDTTIIVKALAGLLSL